MLKDLISALVLLPVALGYYTLASGLGQSALDDEIGAGGLPVIYATLLAAIALALAAKALIAWRFLPAGRNHGDHRLEGEGRKLLRAAGMFGIGVAYVGGVAHIGYPVSLAAAIALVAWYQGEPAGWRLARIAVGGAAVFWIFFDRLLGIDMPPGFWPALWGG